MSVHLGKRTYSFPEKARLVIIFLLPFGWAIAQDSIPVGELTIPSDGWRKTLDPQTLIGELMEGQSSDKEKFDAVFTWVATNIDYDYKKLGSGKSFSSQSNIARILRKKEGICGDYAALMGTLCFLAGLESTVVPGYAKDILFDVNDTLYFDNHVWNAVKLNGYWYVYDVTWSTGSVGYQYTKCAQRRVNWLDKLYAKAIERPYVLRIKKKKNVLCGIPKSEELKTVYVKHIPFFPRVLIRILEFFPFRVVEKYNRVTNLNYYLTLPEVFAIDHFPTVPMWSLTPNLKEITDFTQDSTYFYRLDSLKLYAGEKRLGQKCLGCDDFLSLVHVPKEKEIILKSSKSNPENHFTPATSNLKTANYFYLDVLKEDDSLSKMALVDSTFYYLKVTKDEFGLSKRSARQESKWHKNKNMTKRKLLLATNRLHLKNAKTAFKNITKRHIKIKSINYKARGYEKRNKEYLRKFIRYAKGGRTTSKMKEEKKQKVFSDIERLNFQIDSLNQKIAFLTDTMLTDISDLWENVIEELDYLEPLVHQFYVDGSRRGFGLEDNFDKAIIDGRKLIKEKEELFLSTVDSLVLQLSDKAYAEFILVNRWIKNRNVLQLKSARLHASLRNGKILSAEGIDSLIQEKKNIALQDECFSEDQKELFKELEDNFSFLYDHHKQYYRAISLNNRRENRRYEIIDKIRTTNYRRAYHAVNMNLRSASKIKKALYKHRTKFLKDLKKERKRNSRRT